MKINSSKSSSKTILAFVGMPGAGKSEATQYLKNKGIPFIRFGQLTEDEIKKQGLEVNVENERIFREKIRKEFGMGAYAIKAKPKIDELLSTQNVIALDGLYSWEEYTYLKGYFPFLKLILIYAEPEVRYKRLSQRAIRPILFGESRDRDIREIENLNKGGPIAIADFFIVNNSENLNDLYKAIDKILKRLNIK